VQSKQEFGNKKNLLRSQKGKRKNLDSKHLKNTLKLASEFQKINFLSNLRDNRADI
jgi:hypothetical protein